MNGDAADCQGLLHAGGHWRDTAGLSHEGSDRQALPACIQSAASSSASGVHEVDAKDQCQKLTGRVYQCKGSVSKTDWKGISMQTVVNF